MKDDSVSRAAVLNLIEQSCCDLEYDCDNVALRKEVEALPSAQPEYEPVKAEDFAKTMSENTIYSFMAWHGEALELMERHGFVICKKTM